MSASGFNSVLHSTFRSSEALILPLLSCQANLEHRTSERTEHNQVPESTGVCTVSAHHCSFTANTSTLLPTAYLIKPLKLLLVESLSKASRQLVDERILLGALS